MKNFSSPKKHFLIALFGGLLAITFLASPVMSEDTPEQKLEKANALTAESRQLAADAQKALDDADTLKAQAEVAAELAREASDNLERLRAEGADDTVIAAAETTFTEASNNAAALMTQADTAGAAAMDLSVGLAQQAQQKSDEAAQLISEVTVTAQETGNTELAQAAHDASTDNSAAIAEVTGVTEYIAQTSTDPDVVDAANDVQAAAGETQNQNDTNTQVALDTGAVPGEGEAFEPAAEGGTPDEGTPVPTVPVVPDEPPIDDSDAGSPV